MKGLDLINGLQEDAGAGGMVLQDWSLPISLHSELLHLRLIFMPSIWVQCVWQQDRSCAFRAISEKQKRKITLLISNPGNQHSEKVKEARAERESLMGEAGLGQPWGKMVFGKTEERGKQWYVQVPRRQNPLRLELGLGAEKIVE